MAPPPGTLRVGRYFAVLVLLIAALYSIVFFSGSNATPRLGIDLVGGREVTFTAIAPHGKPPTTAQMEEAKVIMQNRANGNGVTNATVVIQGADQIVIQIPGGTNTDVKKLGQAAALNFRPLVTSAVPIACTTGKAAKTGSAATSASPSPAAPSSPAKESASDSRSPHDAGHQRLDAPVANAPSSGSSGAKSSAKSGAAKSGAAKSGSTTSTTPGAAPSSAASSAAPPRCSATSVSDLTKNKALKITSIPNTEAAYAALTKKNSNAATAIQNALATYDCNATQNELDEKNSYYVACDTANSTAYLLGKVIVPGTQIDSASAQAPSTSGQGGLDVWSVQLNLKGAGSDAWAAWTGKYNTDNSSENPPATTCTSSGAAGTFPCSDYVAFTLNNQVISAPVTQSAINHQATSITGNFQEGSANNLAQQLNYGALPLSFKLQTNYQVSATLGTAQLKAGLLAGGIGLILVVLYSLIYYRGLGTVTIASLIVSAGLTYAMLVLLGRSIGFNLDLSGIAGFIVAIGITADSFVVFFERVKDEVHEGRSMRVAVPRAWVRARRTILSADFVSFLAAAILYYFAAGDVRGFAFTLGLSTILDLVVVFFFTHPMVSLLSRSRTFGSPRFTGLNSVRSGGVAPASSDDERLLQRPKRSRRTPPPTPSRRAATAVLEPDADEPAGEVVAVDATDDSRDGRDDVADTEPRTRTAPEPGTAAERAAARRARLREQRRDGDDGTGER